jgi:hypothetical protein
MVPEDHSDAVELLAEQAALLAAIGKPAVKRSRKKGKETAMVEPVKVERADI